MVERLLEALRELEEGPATFVRRYLEHHVDGQADAFMEVWTRALHSIPRGAQTEVVRQRREWVAALKWARPAFQAAFAGEDVRRGPVEPFWPPDLEPELVALADLIAA